MSVARRWAAYGRLRKLATLAIGGFAPHFVGVALHLVANPPGANEADYFTAKPERRKNRQGKHFFYAAIAATVFPAFFSGRKEFAPLIGLFYYEKNPVPLAVSLRAAPLAALAAPCSPRQLCGNVRK